MCGDFDVYKMCEKLVDKNGNHVDVNEIAGAYLSVLELKTFFKRCTDYSNEEISALSKYIDKLDGNNYRFGESAKVRKRIEESAGVTHSLTSAQIVIPVCTVVFLIAIWRVGSIIGEGSAATVIAYALIGVGICVAIALPQIQTQWKYGKGEFKFSGKLKFISGLNLPQNAKCKVVCLNKRIAVESIGQEFNLPAEKIINVDILTNSEIQKQYVSSVGGAVGGAIAGAMIFPILAPLGAMMGGAVRKRGIKTNTKYLIFAYRNEEKIEYILFDASSNIFIAKRFCNEFKNLGKKGRVKIDI